MYIEVLIEIKNKHVDKTFTYMVPSNLVMEIEIGKRVLVPFGHQTLEGYITNILPSSSIDSREILEVIDSEPILTNEMLEIGVFLKEKTLSSLSACYSVMLPRALKAKKGTEIKKKLETYLVLMIPLEAALKKCKNESQRKVLELFFNRDKILKKEATIISSSVKTLIKNEILKEVFEEAYRYKIASHLKGELKKLTSLQQEAYQKIYQGFYKERVFLLHGVTGSGKTEIYFHLIKDCLNMGKSALVLVPEISITSQLVHRFSEIFPENIAVLHSNLSDGEKYDEWRKISRGEVNIVIGARSAIFAPLQNIGIIIMDEEHSDSYKQESNPKYHALDVAKKRSEIHHCPILLGSATPTLSSMARALKQVYTYVPLLERANGKVLPTCEIVDMTEEVAQRHPILSRELECRIIEKLNKKEQVLLLLNRRGHSTTITCSNCGFTYRCPHCDISLTYHKSSNTNRCHYCGYTVFKEETCPKCKEDSLNYYGLGTEKLEDYLNEIFPTAKIVRMDRDSTSNKGSYEKIIQDFSMHKYDIMLGTQMISKGLDFPLVSLVGILNADASLNIPEFKSNEKTFDLLCQASGRAGRKSTTGEVIIQTFYPNNFVLNCVKNQDYFKFYKFEMNIRKTLKYPPFYYLVHLSIKSKDYELAKTESLKIKKYLSSQIDSESIILGPTTANMFLVNKVYHFEILIKYRFDKKLLKVLKELDEQFLIYKNVTLDIEFEE